MTLLERLQEEMKAAMKSGQKERLGVIRMLISDVKNIDLAPKPTTAEEAVGAYGRKLKKGIEEYERLGRPEEVQQLRREVAIVEEFLPKKASAQETETLVKQFLSQHQFTEKQAGQAMGAFMKAHGSAVEASVANPILRRELAGK